MPRFLKSETKRRLTASQRALSAAFSMLAVPKSVGHEPNDADGALEIGLIGIAADLAISACLYEMLGAPGIIRNNSEFYLSASEALDSFRSTLTSKIPRLRSLTQGTPDPSTHLNVLNEACGNFSVIFTSRAAAIHGGAGISKDVAFVAGKSVADFLLVLGRSSNWKPYLNDVPVVPTLPRESSLIAQELAAQLKSGSRSRARSALSGIFLVLPELSKSEPEWLQSLQRVQVTPRASDITILVKSLQRARVGDVVKVGKGSSAIAARFVDGETNPEAMPVYVAGMKKKFENTYDQWAAYIGLANSELERGILTLPPIEWVYRLSAMGMEAVGVPAEELREGLSAHSLWPFIATSINYSGVKGPCFFLVRSIKTEEYGQLIKQLKDAAKISARVGKELNRYTPLFSSLCEGKPVIQNSELAKHYSDSTHCREKSKDSLIDKLVARTGTVRNKKSCDTLAAKINESDSLHSALNLVKNREIDFGEQTISVMRLLIDSCQDKEDVNALAVILSDKSLKGVATNARKAIADIDYSYYGPEFFPRLG